MKPGASMGGMTLEETGAALKQRVLYPAVGLIVIHVLMMLGWPRPIRLLATIAYFGFVLFALINIREYLPRYLDLSCRRRYADAYDVVANDARSYVTAAAGLISLGAAWLAFVVGAIAIEVLAAWSGSPNLSWIANGLRWVVLILFALAVFYGGAPQIARVLERRQTLLEKAAMLDFLTPWLRPPTKAATVQVSGPYAFQAGGTSWRWHSLFANIVIFGMPGAGKTSCVLNALIDGLLRCAPTSAAEKPAVFLLDAKGDFGTDDAAPLRALCRRHGREDDIRIIDPSDRDRSERWNPFDSDDDPYEIASRIASVMEILQKPGQNDSFFIQACKSFIEHATKLVRATNDPGEPPCFRDISDLAGNDDELGWRFRRITTDEELEPLVATLGYFHGTWMKLPPDTIGSIRAFLNNMIGPFLSEPYATLFAGRSSVRIGDVLDQGTILYLKMPIAERPAMSRTIATLIKLEMQREVRKRVGKARHSLFICDEFQEFATAGEQDSDGRFFALNRASRHVNLIATQNLQMLRQRMPRKEDVDGLLGNCETKIFLQNTDLETNEYASKQFGEALVSMRTEQSSVGGGYLALLARNSTGGGNTVRQPKVPPDEFGRLGKPGPGHPLEAQSFVKRSSGASETDKVERCIWPLHVLAGPETPVALLPAPRLAIGFTPPRPPLPRPPPSGAPVSLPQRGKPGA